MTNERDTLYRLLQSHFNVDEFEELCFDLKIDHEDLEGQSKSARIRALILFCERARRLDQLLTTCRRLRPAVFWPDVPGGPPGEAADRNLEISLRPQNAFLVMGDRIDTLTAAANDGDPTDWPQLADQKGFDNPLALPPGQALLPRTLLGRSWRFPPGINAQGGISLANDDNELNQSIVLILRTIPGQRIMRPDFGSRLFELYFAPNNQETAAKAQQFVADALAQWETRITVTRVTARFAQAFILEIHIDYEVKATGQRERTAYFMNLMDPSELSWAS